ncbi:MAG: 2-hydroxyacid dehydrogenase [Acidimicrobiia bacterium]
MGTVVVTCELPDGSDTALRDAGHVVTGLGLRPGQPDHAQVLRTAVPGADALVSVLWNTIDRDLLAAAGPQLKVVANVAVGYDNIDLAAAADHDVVVCNTPGVLDEATADTAMLLILAAARRASAAELELRSGRWAGWELTGFLGQDLNGRTLGLVGFGRIGRSVGRRARAFGMTVLHHTRRPSGEPGWVSDLDTLLAESDVVSLHLPLTPETRQLIDGRRLALMKPHATLVNTARGPIVDEEALASALERGALFAAGLDVFATEPDVNERLLAAPNATLLPHIGSATIGARKAMAEMACRGVVDVLAGRMPANVVTRPGPVPS